MTTHRLRCASSWCTVELGTIELPDDASPDDVALALDSTLCGTCGAAYRRLVSADDIAPGQMPTEDQTTPFA